MSVSILKHHHDLPTEHLSLLSIQDLTTHDNPPTSQTAPTPSNSVSASSSPASSSSLYYGNLKTPALLLQTAQTKVFKPDYLEGARNVRLIFDSRSQRSYVTNKLKGLLSLWPRHAEVGVCDNEIFTIMIMYLIITIITIFDYTRKS